MSIRGIVASIPGVILFKHLINGEEHGFHDDVILRRLIAGIIKNLPITGFLETGTGLGDSTLFVAKIKPQLPVFTCELNRQRYWHSRIRLWRWRNVEVHRGSSPDFLRDLLGRDGIAAFPLVFLDAHWYDYWPLPDEIRMLTADGNKMIIVIDDFQVPGQPQFGFDVGGGGTYALSGKIVEDRRACNLEMIVPFLNRQWRYHCLFPRYQAQDAFFPGKKAKMRGHVVLFVNCGEEDKAVSHSSKISEHYFAYSIEL
jgi:hypothetical protein